MKPQTVPDPERVTVGVQLHSCYSLTADIVFNMVRHHYCIIWCTVQSSSPVFIHNSCLLSIRLTGAFIENRNNFEKKNMHDIIVMTSLWCFCQCLVINDGGKKTLSELKSYHRWFSPEPAMSWRTLEEVVLTETRGENIQTSHQFSSVLSVQVHQQNHV